MRYYDDGYVHEAGRSTDERLRRRRTAIVVTSVSVVFAVLVLLGVAINRGWVAGHLTTPAPTAAPCTPTPTINATTVHVNVYNGSQKAGLAATAAQALDWQGFVIGAVKNDPLGKQVTGTAEIRYGKKGAAPARLLAGRVPGSTLVQDARTDASVDVVVGAGFSGIPKYTPTRSPSC